MLRAAGSATLATAGNDIDGAVILWDLTGLNDLQVLIRSVSSSRER